VLTEQASLSCRPAAVEDWRAAAGLQRFCTWPVSWWVVAAPLLGATQDADAACSAMGRMPLSVLRCYQCHVPATIMRMLILSP